MVFSFFKKHPGKKPQSAPSPRVQDAGRPAPAKRAPPPTPSPPPQAVHQDAPVDEKGSSKNNNASDFSDFTFSEALPEFHVDGGSAPEDPEVEEATIFFANAQDVAAQAVLEGAVKGHGALAERPWLMLFDLYRVLNQQAAFEALGIEYARAFERSPPNWSQGFVPKTVDERPKAAVGGRLTFSGELLGDNEAAFAAIQRSFGRNAKLRLDMSKVKQCDYAGCALLWSLLSQTGGKKYQIELLGKESLTELLQSKVEMGRAEGKECWLLLIELCQLQGQQEVFEEVAINYAVTFEESPPSWLPGKVVAPEPEPDEKSESSAEAENDGAYYLRGEIKSSRFADLTDYAEARDHVLIDCTELVRMDFVSAGVLLNVLSTVRSSGKPVTFRHPNHLVAELFSIVGMKEIANFIFAKQ